MGIFLAVEMEHNPLIALVKGPPVVFPANPPNSANKWAASEAVAGLYVCNTSFSRLLLAAMGCLSHSLIRHAQIHPAFTESWAEMPCTCGEREEVFKPPQERSEEDAVE